MNPKKNEEYWVILSEKISKDNLDRETEAILNQLQEGELVKKYYGWKMLRIRGIPEQVEQLNQRKLVENIAKITDPLEWK